LTRTDAAAARLARNNGDLTVSAGYAALASLKIAAKPRSRSTPAVATLLTTELSQAV
jgi:hypothetical protein